MALANTIDVLIIGGGPSGSCAGAALARAGLKVRILESSDFAEPRIGESLLPYCNALFEQIGAWEKIEAAGFIRKYGAEFETTDGTQRVQNIFAKGYIPHLDYTYQVERLRFDQLMLDHAVEKGCKLDTTTEIETATEHPNHISLQTQDGQTLKTRWLIDASGRRRFLGKHWKLPTEPNPYPSRVAVFNHFKNAARASGSEAGNIIITRQKKGWFWQIPINEDTTSVGYVSLSADLRNSSQCPHAWFEQNVAQSPAVAERLKAAEPCGDYKTTTDYSHMFEHFCGERYFLVGDAATFSDPIFSSGVYLGLESALAASQAIVDAGENALSSKAQAEYTETLKARTKIIRELVDIFYSDSGFAVFMNPTEKFKLFAAVNSIVAGNTRPGFGVRWRYALFKRICLWNRNYRLVPRVL
jgi:flavin-dependent dehydrogenase